MDCEENRPLIAFIVTSSSSANFYKGQYRFLMEKGFRVLLISTEGEESRRIEEEEGVIYHPVRINREISIWSDILSLINLIIVLFKYKPVAVNAGTPKAGLIGVLASYILGIPRIIYTLHGLRYQSENRFKRKLLVLLEAFTAYFADRVVLVSRSLMKDALEDRIICRNQGLILWNGSSNGVDVRRFGKKGMKSEELLGIKEEDKVIGFFGRVRKDKGVVELLEAWRGIRDLEERAKLLLLGPLELEEGDSLDQINADSRILKSKCEYEEVHKYYQLVDLLVLPSHREGLGYVCLEASASGVPIVGTDIAGIRDSVKDGETGRLVPVKDSGSLTRAIEELLENSGERDRLGRNGETWVRRHFDQHRYWGYAEKFYKNLLN